MSVRQLLFLLLISKSLFAGYSATATISISHTRAGSADLPNFPVLISGTYSQMASVANGGSVTSANGYDIVFTSDSGCTTKMNWETEYWDATGKVAYWVNVPVLSHTLDNTFYACVGNATITTDQSNRTAAWDSNYAGVWHFPNGTTLSAADSTSNSNNGKSVTATATSGKVDGAASFNAANTQSITIAESSSLQTAALTVEMWLYLPSLPGSYIAIARKGTPWFWQITNNNYLGFAINNNYYAAVDYPAAVGWQHIVATYDGTSAVNIYVNGALVNTRSASTIALNTSNLYLGTTEIGSEYLTGTIDEFRISNVARQANWVAADYANQSSPSSFYSLNFPIPGAIATGRPILW